MSSASSETAVDESQKPVRPDVRNLVSLLHPYRLLGAIGFFLYRLYQHAIKGLFAAPYVPFNEQERFGRVAIIGAGLTGISSAAHCVAHGFEVVIFEKDSEVGGIWHRENTTSSLQLNSVLYRFHPAIMWQGGFPKRDEIVGEIKHIWEMYKLQSCTRFNYKVDHITRHALSTDPQDGGHARWVVNDGAECIFDSVIGSVGTCGPAKKTKFPGQDAFKGRIVHSSELDSLSDHDLQGKNVAVVGSGASGVEAVELAVSKSAGKVILLARSDKWIIPRNVVFDTLLSLQPFGRQMPLSFIPEWFIRTFHYRDLVDLSPAKTGIFQGTPIVNDAFLQHIREKKVAYVRGSTKSITEKGVNYEGHDRKGNGTAECVVEADIIVLATGYEKPSLEFLPQDLFPQYEKERSYRPPNLYLQNFSTADWSVLLTNASYKNAIGTVGNWHIGIYTRILLVFLLDPDTRPKPAAMKLWVDCIRYLKTNAFSGAPGLSFFTYAELCIWFAIFFCFNVHRIQWLPFVLFGWGVHPKRAVHTVKAKLA